MITINLDRFKESLESDAENFINFMLSCPVEQICYNLDGLNDRDKIVETFKSNPGYVYDLQDNDLIVTPLLITTQKMGRVNRIEYNFDNYLVNDSNDLFERISNNKNRYVKITVSPKNMEQFVEFVQKYIGLYGSNSVKNYDSYYIFDNLKGIDNSFMFLYPQISFVPTFKKYKVEKFDAILSKIANPQATDTDTVDFDNFLDCSKLDFIRSIINHKLSIHNKVYLINVPKEYKTYLSQSYEFGNISDIDYKFNCSVIKNKMKNTFEVPSGMGKSGSMGSLIESVELSDLIKESNLTTASEIGDYIIKKYKDVNIRIGFDDKDSEIIDYLKANFNRNLVRLGNSAAFYLKVGGYISGVKSFIPSESDKRLDEFAKQSNQQACEIINETSDETKKAIIEYLEAIYPELQEIVNHLSGSIELSNKIEEITEKKRFKLIICPTEK